MNWKRVGAAVTIIGLVSGLTAGCSGGDDRTIRVLMEDISYTDNIKKMLPEFEQKTGIDVTIETVPYNDMSTKILQNFSQQSSYYDAVFTDNVFGSGYYQSKYIEDLAPLAAKDTEYGSLKDFYPPYLAPMTKGKATYGLPVYGESTFLMYRKDLFAKYGVAKPPTTTAELEAAAKKIHEGSGGKVAGITMRGAPGIQSVYPWAGMLRSFGGSFFDDGKIAIDSPAAVAATDYWGELLRDYGPKGAANFDWEQNRIAFTQGKAGMTIDATANGPFNEDDDKSVVAGKVGYAPIPYASGVTRDPENTNNSLNVHALYLSAFSEHTEDTYTFMSWATGETVQNNAVKSVEAVGVTNQQVLTGPTYAKRYAPFQQTVVRQVKTGNVDYLPGGQDSNKIITETGQALSSVLAGQQSAQQAMDAAAKALSDVEEG